MYGVLHEGRYPLFRPFSWQPARFSTLGCDGCCSRRRRVEGVIAQFPYIGRWHTCGRLRIVVQHPRQGSRPTEWLMCTNGRCCSAGCSFPWTIKPSRFVMIAERDNIEFEPVRGGEGLKHHTPPKSNEDLTSPCTKNPRKVFALLPSQQLATRGAPKRAETS